MSYQKFLTSMTGVGNTPPHMQQQQQQQNMSTMHPQFQQQLPPHMQHQQQGQAHHLPQQYQHQQHPHAHQHQSQHQGLHDMLPLSLPPHLHQQPAMAMGMPTLGPSPGPSQYSSLGFYTGFPEPLMYNAQKSQRHRRKSAPGVEHIKHRRTRSGCYTCRNRRIKCDEGQPTCERCKKGKRECIYPDPNSSKSAAAAAAAASAASTRETPTPTPTPSQQGSPETSNEGDDDEMEHESKLDTIADDDEAELSDMGNMVIKDEPSSSSSSSFQFTATVSDRPPLRQSRSVSFMNLKRTNTGPTSAGGAAGTSRHPRQGSETPSLDGKCSSPATSTGTAGSFSRTQSVASSDAYTPTGSAPTLTPADWSHLPQDIRFFLGYFCDNITHFHYCMPIDYESFIHSLLPTLAVRHEALLYALVAFSAYHYMLRDPTATLQQFLQYYDQSVRLLLGTLKRKEPPSMGTLLTVLQLATIEEYLGDWINVMGHQKAALEMITDIYMPDTIVQTPVGRAISHWYGRFDVFVGIMGGFPTRLPRVWFTSLIDYYQGCIASDPRNIVLRVEECSATLRLISYEMSMLFAHAKDGGGGGRGSFSAVAEHARILNDLHAWKRTLDAIVELDSGDDGDTFVVKDFSYAKPLDENDIVDPYEPGQLYYGPLFGVTIMSCDWESVMMMHELQAAQVQMAMAGAAGAEGATGAEDGQMAGAEMAGLTKRAYKICQMFEQLERWPASPPGSLIISQSKLAMATLFLPRDQRHHTWTRRKFALIETMGYIFPVTMRTRMAELFNDPSCGQWWLPNNEGFSPILQSLRAFADERNATIVSAQNENLREVRHVFGKLQIGEGKDRDDAASETGQSIGGNAEDSGKGKGVL